MRLGLILGFALLFLGCKKNDVDPHPRIAGHYFHCKVDGKDWYASSDGDLFAQSMSADLFGDSVLSLAGYQGGESIGLAVFATKLEQNKIFKLSDHTPYNSNATYTNDLSTAYFTTDSIHSGEMSFNLDKSGTIVDGTFAFKACHTVTKKTVSITDGSFSITIRNR